MLLQPEWYTWYGWNDRIFLLVNHLSDTPTLSAAMEMVSWVAQPAYFPVWMALLVVSFRLRPLTLPFAVVWDFAVGELAVWLIVVALKSGLAYPRPVVVLGSLSVHVVGRPEYWHSFPSGHAAMAFLLVGSLLLGKASKILWIPAAVYAVLVAWSRMAVGAHFPADILGGAVIGIFSAALAALLQRLTAPTDHSQDRKGRR